ncbi:hypothetical protein U27_01977 [Candidatus Vecturithrix granuli]|uniref:Uncharacterized protein n=1 Tax=Vecturithrix granuli TaxID=1499967 RepID=A0A0S6WA76_VECG1|nr:hypothetical protein U27_01977 [Candidatus Vecturithrix granuli]
MTMEFPELFESILRKYDDVSECSLDIIANKHGIGPVLLLGGVGGVLDVSMSPILVTNPSPPPGGEFG